MPASEIDQLEATGKVITNLTFNSPASGYVTERNALPNMYVQPDTKLYTVADLSTVWVNAQVFQTDLGKIRSGQSASVTVDAYPGRTFRGRIDLVYPQVDENTRTARVRLVFRNPDLKLTPGMYVNVVLKTPLGRHMVVPSSAIFHSGLHSLVFLNRGGGRLEPHEVEPGLTVNDETIVLKGLKQGGFRRHLRQFPPRFGKPITGRRECIRSTNGRIGIRRRSQCCRYRRPGDIGSHNGSFAATEREQHLSCEADHARGGASRWSASNRLLLHAGHARHGDGGDANGRFLLQTKAAECTKVPARLVPAAHGRL